MKRILILIIAIILVSFNMLACGFDYDKTQTPLEKTEELSKSVYEAVINHDGELFKSQFCESLEMGKENSVDIIYEFLDGEIKMTETDFEKDHYASAGGAGKIREDKISKTFVFKIVFVTDKGTRYKIAGKGDIVNTIVPKNQGLHVVYVYKQHADGMWDYVDYLTLGEELN